MSDLKPTTNNLKWYSFETRFLSLKNQLTEYLKKYNVIYEVSGAYSYYHFEILTDNDGATEINHFLDTVTIYTDGING